MLQGLRRPDAEVRTQGDSHPRRFESVPIWLRKKDVVKARAMSSSNGASNLFGFVFGGGYVNKSPSFLGRFLLGELMQPSGEITGEWGPHFP